MNYSMPGSFCPSLSPEVCENSGPLTHWCHPTILLSAIPLSFCFQYFPGSGSFPMSQLFASGGQNIGVSISSSVLPMSIQGWFPLGLTGLISLQSKGLSRVFSSNTFESTNSLALNLLYGLTLTSVYDYWENHSFDYRDLVGKVMSLLFNTLSRFVIAFLPRSKSLLISWLQSLSMVIWEPKKIKSVTASTYSPSIFQEMMGLDVMIFSMLSFKSAFSLSSCTFIKRLFSSSSLSAIRVVSSAYLRLFIFLPAILIPVCDSSSLTFCMMCSVLWASLIP